jgi:maspardin
MDGTLEYANFRAWVPRNVLSVGALNPQDWVYYDWGPRQFGEPLLCLHAVVGSAESFHLQMLALAERGYRVIAPQLPVYWSVPDFCDGLHMFLDALHVRRVHMYAAGLGGFLALQFTARRPERVASVALTHAFLSTASVDHKVVYSPSVLRWLPDFLVRRAVRSLCPKGPAGLRIAEAAEFVIQNTMTASRDELASRLALMVTDSSVAERLRVPEDRMTLIDASELAPPPAAPASDEARQMLPDARRALLKSGGDFPYLASADEVTMHLVVHLRRNAAPPAEPRPLPPPARPRPSLLARRRPPSSPVASDKGDESSGDAPVDVTIAAGERVAAAERALAESYASQLSQVRPFLADREDGFLIAVLHDCGGDPDRAVQTVRDGQYGERFHVRARRKAVREAVKELRRAAKSAADERAGAALTGGCAASDAGGAGLEVPPDDASAASAAVAAVTVLAEAGRSGAAPRAGAPADPLAGPLAELGGGATGVEPSVAPSPGPVTLATPPPGAPSPFGSGDSPVPSRTDCVEGGGSTSSNGIPLCGGADVGRSDGRRLGGGKRSKRSARLTSLERYPPETDSVAAYVTSEKVGMRSDSKLIGRGPAPAVTSRPGSSGAAPSPAMGAPASGPAGESVTSVPASAAAATLPPTVPGAAPAQGRIPPLRPHAREASAAASLPLTPATLATSRATTAPVGGPAADDGWGEFRRSSLLPLEDVVDAQDASLDDAREGLSAGAHEDSEAARLREWTNSARSATEYAQTRSSTR